MAATRAGRLPVISRRGPGVGRRGGRAWRILPAARSRRGPADNRELHAGICVAGAIRYPLLRSSPQVRFQT